MLGCCPSVQNRVLELNLQELPSFDVISFYPFITG